MDDDGITTIEALFACLTVEKVQQMRESAVRMIEICDKTLAARGVTPDA
jgi:hypothetical protein